MATKLGDQAVGNIVKLNVNGTAKNFIVVHQGNPNSSLYDSSCDGTWVLMEDCSKDAHSVSRVWHSSKNDYANSNIHSYLNETFVNLFDSDIKSVIEQVKLPYTNGTGNGGSLATGSSGISAKVFLLSYTEVGFSGSSNANAEGSVLSYFNGAENSKRVAISEVYETATDWWLRSPRNNIADRAWYVNAQGISSHYHVNMVYGIRPAMILPKNLGVESDGTIVTSTFSGHANIGGTWKELSGGYANIGGTWKEISGAYMNIGGTWKEMS